MNPSIPPSTTEYGGDEVQAIVLDPGYATTRAGFAGEDAPKSIVPTNYGTYSKDGQPKSVYGDDIFSSMRPKFTVKNPMNDDGLVEDWDAAEKVWEYSFTSRLTGAKPNAPIKSGDSEQPADGDVEMEVEGVEEQEKPLSETPLIMTDASWNTAKAREKMIELAMENWGAPAFFVIRSGVAAAFSAGRATAMVIDVGASTTSITPVHDGLHLRRGVQHSQIAGNYISEQCRKLFATNSPQPIDITPYNYISNKTSVDAGVPPQFTYKKIAPDNEPDPSFRRLSEAWMLHEFKESVIQIWAGPSKLPSPSTPGYDDFSRNSAGRPFEFPSGYNQLFGIDRYRVAEPLFSSSPEYVIGNSSTPAPASNGNSSSSSSETPTIQSMVLNALNNSDTDIRPHLLGNIVVTGGSTLIPGFNDRLQAELANLLPAPRIKIHAPGNTVERKFGAWIGASIVASLGTFHQMWISKKEYEEHGASIVEKRCK